MFRRLPSTSSALLPGGATELCVRSSLPYVRGSRACCCVSGGLVEMCVSLYSPRKILENMLVQKIRTAKIHISFVNKKNIFFIQSCTGGFCRCSSTFSLHRAAFPLRGLQPLTALFFWFIILFGVALFRCTQQQSQRAVRNTTGMNSRDCSLHGKNGG